MLYLKFMCGRSVSQSVRFKALAALAAALSVGAGCTASARAPSDSAILDQDPKARPASAPRERAGRVEPAPDPASASIVGASVEHSDLVAERMSFQSEVVERLQKLEQRVMAARQRPASDPELAKLIKAHDEARKACVEAQYGLVITTNDSWPSAKEQLATKLDALEGLVAKIEGSPRTDISGL